MVYLTVLRIHKIAGGKGQRLSLIAFSDIDTKGYGKGYG
jgi:hypothetical protein